MEVASWGARSFQVTAKNILSFSRLLYEFEIETEERNNGTQKYVALKGQKPRSATMQVLLDARLGVSVKEHIDWFFTQMYGGASAYLYVKQQKLLPCELMITKAAVTGMTLAPDGAMISAEMELTFSQSTRMDGTAFIEHKEASSGGGGGGGGGWGGGGGGGGSSKKPSVKKNTSTNGSFRDTLEAAAAAAKAYIDKASRASSVIKRITDKAVR